MQSVNQDDDSLLRQLLAGSEEGTRCVTALYDRYARKFHGFLRRNGLNTQEAEDLVHDVFVKLWNLRGRGIKVTSASAYLWMMLRNALADHWRQRRPEILTDDPPDVAAESEDSDSELDDCIGRAFEAFRRDAPERAQVLYLTVYEDWDIAQVAQVIGRTYNATKEFLSQSRKRFREVMSSMCREQLST